MTELISADPKKKAISYGIVLGIISLILSIVTLYILKSATSLIVSSAVSGILNYLVFLVIICVMVSSLRKYVGGYWDFSVALKNIFIMLAITTLISTLGITLFNVALPQVQEESINNTINLTIESLEKMGSNDEQIDKTVALLDEQKSMLGVFSIGQTIKGLGVSLIIYFVLAIILAAIFKREKPIFETFTNKEEAHPWQEDQK